MDCKRGIVARMEDAPDGRRHLIRGRRGNTAVRAAHSTCVILRSLAGGR
ncbi:hypothetical protein J2S34_001874 [Nitrobacter winogradskyi]|uniref:Uncharacterized protein n=1 Tax=Nitrobacter winogradskyi TaxID=913 RepID=A0ACC6AIA5_NITWI|nr:hypothetical protein [Nitrobacter winogradskyi]